jgi:PhnB protein
MIVSGCEAFVDFLSEAFDAHEAGRTVLPSGRISNIRISIGSSMLMVSEAADDAMHAMPAAYYIYVEDVDRTFAKAIACGATKVFEAMDMPYMDRQAGIVDPFENTWWISKRLVNEPYDP